MWLEIRSSFGFFFRISAPLIIRTAHPCGATTAEWPCHQGAMCHSGGTPKGEDRVNRSSPYVPGTRGGSTLPATGTGTREAPSRRWSSSRVQENMTPIRSRRPDSCSIASAPRLALAEGRAVQTGEMKPSSVRHTVVTERSETTLPSPGICTSHSLINMMERFSLTQRRERRL